MATGVLGGLAIVVWIILSLLLVYGVPLYFIWREQYVPQQEKILWMIGCVVVPWLPFLAFTLVAPLSSVRDR